MRAKQICLILGLVPLLNACASKPVILSTVGPRPVPWQRLLPTAGTGRLQVFTETEEYDWGHAVPYFPHRDYQIFTAEGKHLQRVWNSLTHEDETPAVVDLPAGKYLIQADAEFCGRVRVPVLIRPHELTRVALQPGWTPQGAFAQADLVQSPAGYYVGWRDETGRH